MGAFPFWRKYKESLAEEFTMEHKRGFVYPHVLGNLIFVGNAGGGISQVSFFQVSE